MLDRHSSLGTLHAQLVISFVSAFQFIQQQKNAILRIDKMGNYNNNNNSRKNIYSNKQ